MTKRLARRLLLIGSLVFATDQIIGTILRNLYFRQEFGELSRATYALDSSLAEIVILGSSRASHTYVPEVFELELHRACYNAGRDGTDILYNYAVFKAIIQRYNPKLVVFDISPDELEYSIFQYKRLSLLLPYWRGHPEIRSILELRSDLERFKHMFSAIYPYNSLLIQIIAGNLAYYRNRISDRGYVPLFNIMRNEKRRIANYDGYRVDENVVNALEDICSTCKKRKIDLIFVYSPVWNIIKEHPFNAILYELCLRHRIDYLDMSCDKTVAVNPDYFSDEDHLNDEGARVFSALLVKKIQFHH